MNLGETIQVWMGLQNLVQRLIAEQLAAGMYGKQFKSHKPLEQTIQR